MAIWTASFTQTCVSTKRTITSTNRTWYLTDNSIQAEFLSRRRGIVCVHPSGRLFGGW